MDHFPLPKGKGHIRIPNLTSEDYIRGPAGFEGYPARKKWSSEDVEGKNSFGGRSIAEVQAFFQNWLYFGCAIEVLAISGVVAEQSNLLDANSKLVSTRRLPFLIRQWRQKVTQIEDKNSPVHIQWAMKTALILKEVWGFVEKYCLPYHKPRSSVERQKSGNAASPLPDKIWMSIIALGHTLMEAMISYYDIRRTGNHWGASPMLRDWMLHKGWCPMDVERSLTDMGIDGHYYLAKLSNPEVNVSHELCTTDECLARNIIEASYKQTHKQTHRQQECNCSGMKEVDMSRLVEIINNNKIPVYIWDPVSKELHIESSQMVRRGVSDPAYISISHVWSDGMGNPTGNSLLECHLNSIQEMVNAAAESESPQHFWMDTLCVPVGDSKEMKSLRLKCIRQMASIYKGASAVLVLSSTIQKIRTTDSDAERGLALYLANWNRRLWTFQEGMLAKKILLQFSDQAIDHGKVEYPGVRTSIARGHCVTFPRSVSIGTMSEFVILRDFLRDRLFEQMGPMSARMGPLAPAISAIQFRSTSKRSDETICLGTLLRLKIERLQGAEEDIREEYRQKGIHLTKVPDHDIAERRMEIFLSMVRVFPRDIIFNSHRRLAKEGFRWAPASLLGIPRRGFVRNVEGSYAIFDKERRCLSFTGPGITIQVPTDAGGSSKPSTDYLIVELQRDGQESLRLRIDSTRPKSHSGGFLWTPGNYYGIILTQSFSKDMQEPSEYRNSDWIPKNGPQLEEWFESLFPSIETAKTVVDAVIGSIRHGHADDYSETNPVQIRHECLGKVTLLNPSAIAETDKDIDSAWESESEDSGDLESGPASSKGSDSEEVNSDDSEGFSLSEDYEVGSEPGIDENNDPITGGEDTSSDEWDVGIVDDIIGSDEEWDVGYTSDSELGDELPVRDSDSPIVEETDKGFGFEVQGTLKRENTQWYIF